MSRFDNNNCGQFKNSMAPLKQVRKLHVRTQRATRLWSCSLWRALKRRKPAMIAVTPFYRAELKQINVITY